jgi:hypothetical protein
MESGMAPSGREQGVLTIEADCDKLDKCLGQIQSRIVQTEEFVYAF